MQHVQLPEPFTDARGEIRDVLTVNVNSITQIRTLKDAVRGNHVHKLTVQWTYVLTGRLLVANSVGSAEVGPGELIVHGPGEPHAWKALEDTDCLVFTRGPRAGQNYADDTYRLKEPLLT